MVARKKANKSKEVENLRNDQLIQITETIEDIEDKIQEVYESKKKRLPMLDSVSVGLYEELDKLCKKAPAEPITDLVLEQVNDVIKESKQLAQTDPFVQKLNEFIAAGDNPEHRDVVVVLRQVRQGLGRCRNEFDSQISKLKLLKDEAEGIQLALYIFVEDKEKAIDEHLDEYNILKSKQWFTGYDPNYFNYEKLDGLDIKNYFMDNE